MVHIHTIKWKGTRCDINPNEPHLNLLRVAIKVLIQRYVINDNHNWYLHTKSHRRNERKFNVLFTYDTKKKEFVTRPDSIVFCAERWRDKFIYNTEGNEKDIGKSMGMITFRNKTAHQFLIRETIFSLLKK